MANGQRGGKPVPEDGTTDSAATNVQAPGAENMLAVMREQMEAMQVELAQLREERAAGGAVAAIEKLTEALQSGAAGGAAGTFRRGESAVDVMRSLEGTAVAEGADDDLLPEEVVFRSKGSNFQCVRKARHRWVTPTGETSVSEGITMDFSPHGEFRTRSRQNVEFLRSRDSFNVEFYELGHEPGAVPSSEGVLVRASQALHELDDAKLEELLREEEQTHRRPEVVATLQSMRLMVQDSVPA